MCGEKGRHLGGWGGMNRGIKFNDAWETLVTQYETAAEKKEQAFKWICRILLIGLCCFVMFSNPSAPKSAAFACPGVGRNSGTILKTLGPCVSKRVADMGQVIQKTRASS